MKRPLTEKQRQWLWFAGLWCGGLASVLVLGYGIKLFFALIGMDN